MRIAAKHIFVLLLVLVIRSAAGHGQIYNVFDFHAAGDAKTDDAQAFLKTWQAACYDSSWPILVIPGGRTFLLSQIEFQGPCKSPITIQLDGNIVAPSYIWTTKADNLLTFRSVDNLTLEGNGQIDGNGAIWWTCYNQKRCNTRPILLAFVRCNNLWVRRIHLKNSADKHMTLFQCSQVDVYNVSITAPGDSPNTDGITMAVSHHVHISYCSIQTGDDCVSILSNTTDVEITQSACGPGHGISVGSLGADADPPALVERITVSNCNFFGTMNGVRIKSWQHQQLSPPDCTHEDSYSNQADLAAFVSCMGGKGYAKGFLFQNIKMTGVQNPIIIDQFYCPQGNCPLKDGGVAISDARYINIYGTSSRQQAINFLCSESVHCQGIYLRDVNLSWGNHTAPANASVLNVHGTTAGMVVPKVEFSHP